MAARATDAVALPFMSEPNLEGVDIAPQRPVPRTSVGQAPRGRASSDTVLSGLASTLGRSLWVTITGLLALFASIFLWASCGAPWATAQVSGAAVSFSPFKLCTDISGVGNTCVTGVDTGYNTGDHTLYLRAVGGLNVFLGLVSFALFVLACIRVFLPSTRAAEVAASRTVLVSLAALVAAGTLGGLWAASVESARLTATIEAGAAARMVTGTASATGGMYLTLVALLDAVALLASSLRVPHDEVEEVDMPYVDENAGLLTSAEAARARKDAERQRKEEEKARKAAERAAAASASRSYRPMSPPGGVTDPRAVRYEEDDHGYQQPYQAAPYQPPMQAAAQPTFMAGPVATLTGGESVTVPVFSSSKGGAASGGNGAAGARRARANLVSKISASVGATSGDVASEEDALNLLNRAVAALERAAPDLDDGPFKEAALEYLRSALDQFGVPSATSAAWLVAADRQLNKAVGGSR